MLIPPGEYYAWVGHRSPAHWVRKISGAEYRSVYGTAVCGSHPWAWQGYSELPPNGKALCRRCFRNREETGE